jgi:hypothetical protein
VIGRGHPATVSAIRTVLLALLACAGACTEPPDPHDGPIDAGRPDAAPDARPDAMPDAPPAIDDDHDGHPAGEDCDDHDPAVWQSLAYAFLDADGDGHTVSASGTVCSGASLPPGYSLTPGELDCNDADPAVFTSLTGFVDVDADGVGDGDAMSLCTGGTLPDGFAATAGDCAPLDPARWQDLAYSFRDGDGDGAVVPEIGLVCSGTALPPTYLMSAPPNQPFDCNDGDAGVATPLTVFADTDGDGFGAGPAQQACTDGTPPAGFAIAGSDCDDGDAAVWQSLVYTAVDFDEDGVTVPATGSRCTAGVLLPPYFAAPHGNDCDDMNPAVSIALTVFADGDGDGFGAGPAQQACTDGTPPHGFATNGTDCDDVDAAHWELLTYRAIDSDRDGITVTATGQVCTNGTLPPPFKATPNGNDCDDDDPALTHFAVLYPDHDGDGVGAPPRQITCIGATIPAGLSSAGFDDDDGDSAVTELDDDELDLLLLGE